MRSFIRRLAIASFYSVRSNLGASLPAPVVVSLSPTDGATTANPGTSLAATFDMDVQFGATVLIELYSSEDRLIQAWTEDDIGSGLSVTDDTVTATLSTLLPAEQDCYVNISSGSIESLSSVAFAGISDATTWAFTTDWVRYSASGATKAHVDCDFENTRFFFNGGYYVSFAALLTAIGGGTDHGDGTYTLGPVSNAPFPGYNAAEGTVVDEYTVTTATASTFAWTIQQSGVNTESIRELAVDGTGVQKYEVIRASVAQASLGSVTTLVNERTRSVAVYKLNDFSLHINTPATYADTSGNISAAATSVVAMIGHRASALKMVGTTHRWVYFASALDSDSREVLSRLSGQVMFGAWTWFNDPRALVIGGETYVGSVRPNTGTIHVAGIRKGPATLHNALEWNDHDNPGFLRRSSDGKILAHYSKHAADNNHYQALSTNADDLSAWGAGANISGSTGGTSFGYGNLIELTAGIFSFFKCLMPSDTGKRGPAYSKSTDNGGTWGALVELTSGTAANGPYVKLVKAAANRIECLISSGHPGSDGDVSMYSIYYDGAADKWYDRANAEITLPINFGLLSASSKIYDGTSVDSWNWDIQMDGANPVVVFATFPTPASDHRYQYAKWNGTSWDVNEVCTAGGPLYAAQTYYSGGICIDPDDINTVYCSRNLSGSVFEIHRGVTTDGGETWVMTALTAHGTKSFRPYKAAGSNYLLYPSGTYTNFAGAFNTFIKALFVPGLG